MPRANRRLGHPMKFTHTLAFPPEESRPPLGKRELTSGASTPEQDRRTTLRGLQPMAGESLRASATDSSTAGATSAAPLESVRSNVEHIATEPRIRTFFVSRTLPLLILITISLPVVAFVHRRSALARAEATGAAVGAPSAFSSPPVAPDLVRHDLPLVQPAPAPDGAAKAAPSQSRRARKQPIQSSVLSKGSSPQYVKPQSTTAPKATARGTEAADLLSIRR